MARRVKYKGENRWPLNIPFHILASRSTIQIKFRVIHQTVVGNAAVMGIVPVVDRRHFPHQGSGLGRRVGSATTARALAGASFLLRRCALRGGGGPSKTYNSLFPFWLWWL